MKKLLLTLGLLFGTGTLSYGMEAFDLRRSYGTTVMGHIRSDKIIERHDWFTLVKKIMHEHSQNTLEPMQDLLCAETTFTSTLNAPNRGNGSHLLPALMFYCDNDGCRQILAALLRNNKLDLTAIDEHGKLLCNDDILDDRHKERLLEILTTNNIPNPFTHTNDPTLGMTFHLKRSARTIQHYKLWFCGAVIVIAAVGIYKWRKAKADKTDAAGNEQDEAQEEHGAKQVITEK